MFRRSFLTLAMSLVACSPFVHAQGAYPEKPIRFIVPFATGGDTDIVAREIAAKLAERYKYTVIVENKPGAGSLLGAEYMLQQPADGYAVLVMTGSYLTSALTGKPSFDTLGAIQPVIQLTRVPGVLVVGGESQFKSIEDLIAGAKAAPGKVTYASAGVGSLSNVTGEWLADLAKVKFTHIPYKGAGAPLTDLASNQVDFMLSGYGAVRPLGLSGKLRPLAVAWPTRMADAPNVPTFAEVGLKDFDVEFWHGIVAARNVPPTIVAKLNRDINDVLRDPALKVQLTRDSVAPAGGKPEQFRDVMGTEFARWQRIVKSAGIKAE